MQPGPTQIYLGYGQGNQMLACWLAHSIIARTPKNASQENNGEIINKCIHFCFSFCGVDGS